MGFPKRKNIQDEVRQKLVIVGSKNPVKISCTDAGFHQAFAGAFLVEGLNVDSGVSAQPKGDEETLQGAINRAKNSKAVFPEADFWVGIEGGVDSINGEMHAFAWIVVVDSFDNLGKSKTSTFILPPAVAELVESGLELGEADDKVFDRENSKQGNGAVGILTSGALDRKEYYQQAVVLALIPFINTDMYKIAIND
ncbi:Inosine/xanthosine triphosphatase [Indibacter alkaliphilus LW1]|jgi:inosine/xanthosine triphosphatase|uniref:Probable inosine/xanthosine triphosphatase n=1 Tax=Indibacter alkaliphilus (strain CCUG 57479 / KCTC 22604 / LW1) TaxID=1189612 RepID=S2CZE9_INDAL|nr:inosine/xanthosine triphosphatase [Indibacter alkaliphilus]EOZ91989.1 Inosine/xanthosine triphosphatase [Indibacter alkaliphilus LW1]